MKKLLASLLRRVFLWQPINNAVTSTIHALLGTRVVQLKRHVLPRVGTISINAPSGGTIWMWTRGDDPVASAMWWGGYLGFEPTTTGIFVALAARSRVVFDVGAYTGAYALLAAAMNPEALVFAFEPHPGVMARMERNISLNAGVSVVPVPIAVAARKGFSDLHIGGPGLASSSSLSKIWSGRFRSVLVPTVDLDTFVRERQLSSVDLVKIDVETTESDVIRGMERVLQESRPFVISEFLPHDPGRYESMAEILVSVGYLSFLIEDGRLRQFQRLSQPHLANGNPVSRGMNFLNCPRERLSEAKDLLSKSAEILEL